MFRKHGTYVSQVDIENKNIQRLTTLVQLDSEATDIAFEVGHPGLHMVPVLPDWHQLAFCGITSEVARSYIAFCCYLHIAQIREDRRIRASQ
jgi:hypothetical protein